MSAELRCNAVVLRATQDNRCPKIFPIFSGETPREARQRAHQKGWRVRISPSLPVMDRCPEHAKERITQ